MTCLIHFADVLHYVRGGRRRHVRLVSYGLMLLCIYCSIDNGLNWCYYLTSYTFHPFFRQWLSLSALLIRLLCQSYLLDFLIINASQIIL
jgi:hypothetical protein